MLGFATTTDNAAGPFPADESPRKGRWRATDLRRAIAAAEKAGLTRYRVEIAPDGTISVIVVALAEPADKLGP